MRRILWTKVGARVGGAFRLFSELPPNFADPTSYVDMDLLFQRFTQVVGSGRVTLIRSEPQSGKSSFAVYASMVKKTAIIDGVELRIVNITSPSGLKSFLCNPSIDPKQKFLILFDEAHQLYDDRVWCDYIKTYFGWGPHEVDSTSKVVDTVGWKLVFIGTSTGNSTTHPNSPFVFPSYYMSPQFASREVLLGYIAQGFSRSLAHLTSATCQLLASLVVDFTGLRVGLASYCAYKLSINPSFVTLMRPDRPPWHKTYPQLLALLFDTLRTTRLLSGQSGAFSGDDSKSIVAAAMRAGALPEDVWDRDNLDHRRLFNNAGLRLGGLPTSDVGRYGTKDLLVEIKDGTSPMTCVAALAFQELLATKCLDSKTQLPEKGLYPRYKSVSRQCMTLPVIVDTPTTAVDLVLCILPYLNMVSLAYELPDAKKKDFPARGKKKKAGYLLAGIPLEVGGFQVQLREACRLVFGVEKQQTAKDAQVDFVYQVAGKQFAVEVLVGTTSASTLRSSLMEHHGRWGTRYPSTRGVPFPCTRSSYAGNGALTLAFADFRDDETARVEAMAHAAHQLAPITPLMVVRYKHGAYSLECALFTDPTSAKPSAKFVLDIDGVAMKLKGNEVVSAQRLVNEVPLECAMWINRYRKDAPRLYFKTPDGEASSVHLSSPFDVAAAVQAIEQKQGRKVAHLRLLDPFGRKREVVAKKSDWVCMTSDEHRIEVVYES